MTVRTVPKKEAAALQGPPEGDLCYTGRHICRWADVCGRVGKLTTGIIREGPQGMMKGQGERKKECNLESEMLLYSSRMVFW